MKNHSQEILLFHFVRNALFLGVARYIICNILPQSFSYYHRLLQNLLFFSFHSKHICIPPSLKIIRQCLIAFNDCLFCFNVYSSYVYTLFSLHNNLILLYMNYSPRTPALCVCCRRGRGLRSSSFL